MNRKAHWEKVYAEKSPKEVSWYQPRPERSLALIQATGLGPEAALIDVGGGASTLVDNLLQSGYRDLAVLDISGAALAHTRQRLGPAAAEVAWYEADVTEFRPPRAFDIWHDRAVFHFLTEAADRAAYLEALRAGLRPGGHLILATFALDGPEKCSGLPVQRYDAAALAATLGADFELLGEESEAHLTPAEATQRFGYFHFRRRP